MMADLMNALGGKLRTMLVYLFEQRLLRENFFVELRAGRVEAENLTERRVIEAVRYFVDIAQRQPRLLKAIGDRLDRKIARLFVAIEPLFGRRGLDLAVHDQRVSRVETLQNPVLPLIQTRPMCPFEPNGFSESADAENCAHFLVLTVSRANVI